MSVKRIRLSKSCLGVAERQAVDSVLEKEYLGMGVEVRQFEEALGEFFGRPTVCVMNGTAALHLALQASDVGPGDEVLVPSLTYLASFQAISATGARPVACEVNKNNLCLDPKDAEQRISKYTKAIMPVHYAGGVGALDETYRVAEQYELRVIEDAAHAFGSTYQGKRIGSFGDIACFSFDGIKNITSGEGGCIVTDDKDILRLIRDARLLGVERDTEARYQGGRSWDFDVSAQGWRYHMSNIMAAIGIVQLSAFDEVANKRRALAECYGTYFNDHDLIKPLLMCFDFTVPHIYVVRIAGLRDRDGLRQRLLKKGIETGVHYQPNHHLTFFQESSTQELPITEHVYSEILTLPLHPELSNEDIVYVAESLLYELQDGFFTET